MVTTDVFFVPGLPCRDPVHDGDRDSRTAVYRAPHRLAQEEDRQVPYSIVSGVNLLRCPV